MAIPVQWVGTGISKVRKGMLPSHRLSQYEHTDLGCWARALVTRKQFLLLWVLWLFLIELYVKTNTPLQGFFIYAVHDADIGEKKIQSRAVNRQLSDNSISPKQELSLSREFLKGPYNDLCWKEFRPPRWSSKSRASFQFNEVAQVASVSKKVSSMCKNGNSPTLLDKYCSVSDPHCAEIFYFYLSGRFNISVLKVKKC